MVVLTLIVSAAPPACLNASSQNSTRIPRDFVNSAAETAEWSKVNAAVDARGLVVAFGPVVAVSGFDLSVPAGTSVALVGRNGAGKSTTLKVLAGVLPPTYGVVQVAGIDVVRHPERARAAVPRACCAEPRPDCCSHVRVSAPARR